jgi:hypothetical protein
VSEDRSSAAGHNESENAGESAPGLDELHEISRRALDLFVFAPAGIVLTAIEEFPELATKGRSKIELQVNNARVMGQFVVTMGRAELKRRLSRTTQTPARPPSSSGTASSPSDRRPASTPEAPMRSEEPSAPGPAVGAAGSSDVHTNGSARWDSPQGGLDASRSGEATRGKVDAVIADYDALSASQVVRRLDSLSPEELDAVYHHEAATRRRRTILHRAQQLLGIELPPGSPNPTG